MEKESDFPINSSLKDLIVDHVVMNFNCYLEDHKIDAVVTMFLKSSNHCDPAGANTSGKVCTKGCTTPDTLETSDYEFVLDCHKINFKRVCEVQCPENSFQAFRSESVTEFVKQCKRISEGEGLPLEFDVSDWCIRIRKKGVKCHCRFPKVIHISYTTSKDGHSLKWCMDQDGNACVITSGGLINNRSLVPGQDQPLAVCTWQADVTCAGDWSVVLSSDQPPEIVREECGLRTYRAYSLMKLPLCTLTLGVMRTQRFSLPSPLAVQRPTVSNAVEGITSYERDSKDVTVTFHFCESLAESVNRILVGFFPTCLAAATELLGLFPFAKLDVLIGPPSFGNIGLACPSLLIFSQSCLSDDGSMLVSVCHEVTHAWFGLLIGLADWTEEWLTEGLATYFEDLVYCRAVQMCAEDVREWRELQQHLKLTALLAELDNSSESLHTLKREGGGTEDQPGPGTSSVPDGLNPERTVSQIHYLKGFFMLIQLESVLGEVELVRRIRNFVNDFQGCLVTSEQFLAFVAAGIEQNNSHLTVAALKEEWLNSPDLPTYVRTRREPNSNSLYISSCEEISYVKRLPRGSSTKKRARLEEPEGGPLTPLQKQVVLDRLLQETKFSSRCLDRVADTCSVHTAGPQIRHKWFELVVKHKLRREFPALGRFLVDHQAMGIYLYGEMMISGNEELIHLARETFTEVQDGMDHSSKDIVKRMLYG